MSETERRDQRVAANARGIEEAIEHLAETVDGAREAARRAHEADSMASPGDENTVSEAEPARDEDEHDEAHEDGKD